MSRHGVAGPAAGALAALALLSGTWLLFGEAIRGYDRDLDVFVTAGVRAVRGEDLYRASDGDMPFKYAPVTAFFFAPLATLPDGPRSALWFAFSMGCVAAAVALYWRAVLGRGRPRSLRDAAPLLLALVASQAFLVRLARNGQTDGLVLLLCVLAGHWSGRGQAARAAWAWAAAVALKIVPAVLALHLARRRPVATAGWALAAGVTLAAAPAAVWGVHRTVSQHRAWMERLAARTPSDLDYPSNHSIWAFARRLVTPGDWPALPGTPEDRVTALTAILVLGAVALAVRAMRIAPDDPEGRAVSLAAALALAPLLSPISWAPTCVMTIPALVVLLATRDAATGGRWRDDALWLLSALAFNLWLGWGFQAVAPRMWGNLLVLIALGRRAWQLQLRANPGAGRIVAEGTPGRWPR
jgi:hypothetical protein